MKNRRNFIAPTILSVLLIVALVWGYNQYQIKKQHEIALENHYQRLFFDVKKHVENVQVNLSKAMLASSREQNIVLFSQIMNEAFFAKDKLAQMPITHAESAKTEKFLTQAADYSAYLIQRHLQGEEITKEQRETLNGLQANSAKFNAELSKLHESLMESNFVVGELSNKQSKRVEKGNESVFQTSLVTLDKQMAKTPELIYDGPFSDQIINRKPVGLPREQVSQEQAKNIAQDFFGRDRVKGVKAFEEGEHINEVKIPAYTFLLYPENQQKDLSVYMGVSRQGGKVVWMANPRPVSNVKLSIKNAEEKALRYLKDKGFENMEPNYSLKYDGTILFNFAYKENNITIYPDLIKVKVALDTGEIVGFDASAYYMNHKDRNIDTPHIAENEARAKVKMNFNIDSIRLALIPKGKNEVLCYEFKGKYNDSDFIIYINALNGREEQILQIIKDENGTLTF
ncbi:germination protein YpeB [Tissierella praeacuta]|uniref:Spore germination protein n=1 Tax=Tissierella praeacuta DSM 18095 TaxID=1123404 RepID=A0A1M4XTP0_9FIRM|nr:germination protein YpeB [Tissierella praeacuta]MBU5255504.1 germination protein YpeB [Tissierella praeacuta]TCU79192.1 spore germination protein [Tissierella praeacuta]SHE96716.1 spore germination protein [Tissierella praeacuta DSM 18095]SUO99185.1 PSPA12 [Tissierella praeacuta]